MKLWADIGFEVEITKDGSPSLRLLNSQEGKVFGEAMHHSGGASSETMLIYGSVIRSTLENIKKPRFLVIGLGLGYIEMNIARECLLKGIGPEEISGITTFESVTELREFFINWLTDERSENSQVVNETYDAVLNSLITGTQLDANSVKKFLHHFFRSASDIQRSLEPETSIADPHNCILYDAFSSKTTPYLWEEDFLVNFLKKSIDSHCYFSTYACRGSLKRALKQVGFSIYIREGFEGKRNSTAAEIRLS